MIFDKIKSLKSIPFHTPGHKRNTNLLGNDLPYELDVTEIEGFDNLHSPSGILLGLNQKINKLYDAKKSYALVNGSTVGILAAINSIVREDNTVLMARNCHKSVYSAVEISKAKAEYITPDYDEYGIAKGITAGQFEAKITEDIKLLVITSPTYEGVESDVDGICKIAHKHNIPVLIDAAHGAHLFEKYHNADIVIRGLHKTLPALTQCAAANIYGDLVDTKQFEYYLSIFETSSPSYVLLLSIEKCLDFINTDNNYICAYYKSLIDLYDISLNHLKVIKYDDIGKIIVFTGFTNISGYTLADKLREYNIEPEMATRDYIIAISTICDEPENINALKYALECIDKCLEGKSNTPNKLDYIPRKSCEAFELDNNIQAYSLDECINKVSAEYIWAYPPGIPIIVPGEIIDNRIIEYINNNVTEFNSTYGALPEKIYCQS